MALLQEVIELVNRLRVGGAVPPCNRQRAAGHRERVGAMKAGRHRGRVIEQIDLSLQLGVGVPVIIALQPGNILPAAMTQNILVILPHTKVASILEEDNLLRVGSSVPARHIPRPVGRAIFADHQFKRKIGFLRQHALDGVADI